MAQTLEIKNPVQPLKVGDRIPDLFLGKVMNHPVLKKAKFSDFRGKYLILDFWSIYCATCIAEMPRMKILQEKYKDKLTILPIGFDGYEAGSIEKYLNKKMGTSREFPLPTAIQSINDTLLIKLFPCEGFPHEVWIDPNGFLLGTTSSYAVNESNIESLLSGHKIDLGLVKIRRYLSPAESFLIPKSNNTETQRYGSLFSGYIDTIKKGEPFARQWDSSYYRFYDVNSPILSYYIEAYKSKMSFFNNKVSFNQRYIITDSSLSYLVDDFNSKYVFKDDKSEKEFRQRALFSYDLILPRSFKIENVYDYMIKDFNNFFRIKSEIKEVERDCFVLINILQFQNKGNYSYAVNNSHTSTENMQSISTMDQLLPTINSILPFSAVLVNQANFKNFKGITVPEQLDIKTLKKLLNEVGFDLLQSRRKVKCLVLERK